MSRVKPGSGRKWSEEEEAHCLAMIDRGVSYQQIGAILDRTEKAVANRAIILGRPRSREYPLAWSDDDDAMLQRLWASGATDKTMAKFLGRTQAATEARRRVLGLMKRPRSSKPEDTQSDQAKPMVYLVERDLYADWIAAMERVSSIAARTTRLSDRRPA